MFGADVRGAAFKQFASLREGKSLVGSLRNQHEEDLASSVGDLWNWQWGRQVMYPAVVLSSQEKEVRNSNLVDAPLSDFPSSTKYEVMTYEIPENYQSEMNLQDSYESRKVLAATNLKTNTLKWGETAVRNDHYPRTSTGFFGRGQWDDHSKHLLSQLGTAPDLRRPIRVSAFRAPAVSGLMQLEEITRATKTQGDARKQEQKLTQDFMDRLEKATKELYEAERKVQELTKLYTNKPSEMLLKAGKAAEDLRDRKREELTLLELQMTGRDRQLLTIGDADPAVPAAVPAAAPAAVPVAGRSFFKHIPPNSSISRTPAPAPRRQLPAARDQSPDSSVSPVPAGSTVAAPLSDDQKDNSILIMDRNVSISPIKPMDPLVEVADEADEAAGNQASDLKTNVTVELLGPVSNAPTGDTTESIDISATPEVREDRATQLNMVNQAVWEPFDNLSQLLNRLITARESIRISDDPTRPREAVVSLMGEVLKKFFEQQVPIGRLIVFYLDQNKITPEQAKSLQEQLSLEEANLVAELDAFKLTFTENFFDTLQTNKQLAITSEAEAKRVLRKLDADTAKLLLDAPGYAEILNFIKVPDMDEIKADLQANLQGQMMLGHIVTVPKNIRAKEAWLNRNMQAVEHDFRVLFNAYRRVYVTKVDDTEPPNFWDAWRATQNNIRSLMDTISNGKSFEKVKGTELAIRQMGDMYQLLMAIRKTANKSRHEAKYGPSTTLRDADFPPLAEGAPSEASDSTIGSSDLSTTSADLSTASESRAKPSQLSTPSKQATQGTTSEVSALSESPEKKRILVRRQRPSGDTAKTSATLAPSSSTTPASHSTRRRRLLTPSPSSTESEVSPSPTQNLLGSAPDLTGASRAKTQETIDAQLEIEDKIGTNALPSSSSNRDQQRDAWFIMAKYKAKFAAIEHLPYQERLPLLLELDVSFKKERPPENLDNWQFVVESWDPAITSVYKEALNEFRERNLKWMADWLQSYERLQHDPVERARLREDLKKEFHSGDAFEFLDYVHRGPLLTETKQELKETYSADLIETIEKAKEILGKSRSPGKDNPERGLVPFAQPPGTNPERALVPFTQPPQQPSLLGRVVAHLPRYAEDTILRPVNTLGAAAGAAAVDLTARAAGAAGAVAARAAGAAGAAAKNLVARAATTAKTKAKEAGKAVVNEAARQFRRQLLGQYSFVSTPLNQQPSEQESKVSSRLGPSFSSTTQKPSKQESKVSSRLGPSFSSTPMSRVRQDPKTPISRPVLKHSIMPGLVGSSEMRRASPPSSVVHDSDATSAVRGVVSSSDLSSPPPSAKRSSRKRQREETLSALLNVAGATDILEGGSPDKKPRSRSSSRTPGGRPRSRSSSRTPGGRPRSRSSSRTPGGRPKSSSRTPGRASAPAKPPGGKPKTPSRKSSPADKAEAKDKVGPLPLGRAARTGKRRAPRQSADDVLIEEAKKFAGPQQRDRTRSRSNSRPR